MAIYDYLKTNITDEAQILRFVFDSAESQKTRNVHDLDDISNILSSVVSSLSNAEKIDRLPNTSAISKTRFLSIPHSVLTSRASAISVHR